ncbi:MAG: hypothetical protein E7277_09810 [Lachnospiraceae bacterium]|nr:hypothetical protein [Lachnospiraceae bacterium]
MKNQMLEKANALMKEHIVFRNVVEGMKFRSLTDYLEQIDGIYSPRVGRFVFLWPRQEGTGATQMASVEVSEEEAMALAEYVANNHLDGWEDILFTEEFPSDPKYSFFQDLVNDKENLTILQKNTAEYQNMLALMSRALYDGEAYLTEAITIAARSDGISRRSQTRFSIA